MKIAIKNFLTTLRRYKVASVLNIAGMTLAFLAFYVIMSQVFYDMTYNRSIKDSARTYILVTRFAEADWMALASRMDAENALSSWTDVECFGAILKRGMGSEYVWVKLGGSLRPFRLQDGEHIVAAARRVVVPHRRG